MNHHSVNLVAAAKDARSKAYAPYSCFAVGAALLSQSGKITLGCNIENASYGLSNCAERTAIFSAMALATHEEDKQFIALAVVADTERPIPPCGACRQVIAEFCAADMPIYLANLHGEILATSIHALLPGAFSKEDIQKGK